jgi:hypothetical protein
MYIEELLGRGMTAPLTPEGATLDIEFSTRRLASGKFAVYQRRVGCVFIGPAESDCAAYIRDARARKAVKQAEKDIGKVARGMNPFFTR